MFGTDTSIPTLKAAKKTSQTDFGPQSSQFSPNTPRVAIATPLGTYIDNGDGTVSHEESGLQWIRAPWGMVWNGNGFDGEPIKLGWKTAAKLFGKGATIGFCGAELRGEQLEKSSFQNGYTPGKCTVNFAGFSDWRLPTAIELDTMAVHLNYGDPREHQIEPWLQKLWRWRGEDNLLTVFRLFPEFMRSGTLLWTATGIGGHTAYAYDGKFPVGDHDGWRSEFGVMFVRRSVMTDFGGRQPSKEKLHYNEFVTALFDGRVDFLDGKEPKIGTAVSGGDDFATQYPDDPAFTHSGVQGSVQLSYHRNGTLSEVYFESGQVVRVGDRLVKIQSD